MNIKYVSFEGEKKQTEEANNIKYEPLPKMKKYDMNSCGFGDEYFLFHNGCGLPKYEDMETQWNVFIDWVKTVMSTKEESDDIYRLGKEVIRWAEDRDPFALYMLTRTHWVEFRDNYLTEDAPFIVKEIIDEIMAGKMTEKEKWGTDEDRKPKGEIIIYKDSILTPEESYYKRKQERKQKYDPEKHKQRVKRDYYEMLETHKKEI